MNLRAVQESLVEASTIPVQIHVTQYSSQVERVKHHHYPTDTEIKDKKILKHFAREGLNVNSAIAQQPRGEGSRLPTETAKKVTGTAVACRTNTKPWADLALRDPCSQCWWDALSRAKPHLLPLNRGAGAREAHTRQGARSHTQVLSGVKHIPFLKANE